MGSAHYIAAAFEIIFDECKAENFAQVANGISYITEENVIARFLLQQGYPPEMSDTTNSDPNADESLKYTSMSLSQHFLLFYRSTFEQQLESYYN